MDRADKRWSRNSTTRRRKSDELWRLGEILCWRRGINNWNSRLIQGRTTEAPRKNLWMNKMRDKEKLFRSLKSSAIRNQNCYYIMNRILFYTRVGTLIAATIYLQLIQNRYMFRSFTVLHCSHQHCLQPVASDVEVVGYL